MQMAIHCITFNISTTIPGHADELVRCGCLTIFFLFDDFLQVGKHTEK